MVFAGRDTKNIPCFAHCRGTTDKFRLDVAGLDKSYGFCYQGNGSQLCVFEAPIDLLSFICLFPKDWQNSSYLSLGGVADKALIWYLNDHHDISKVFLCLDSDEAGEKASRRIAEELPEGLAVVRLKSVLKDWNEVLLHKHECPAGKR